MEIGKNYINGGMKLILLERLNNYYIYFRLNDNTYIATKNTTQLEYNNITWSQGHYFTSLEGVIDYIREVTR